METLVAESRNLRSQRRIFGRDRRKARAFRGLASAATVLRPHTSSIYWVLPRGPTVHLSCGVCLLGILATCLPAPTHAASLATAGITGRVFAGAAMESSKKDLTYTSCYCEENVYTLCEQLLGRPDRTSAGSDVRNPPRPEPCPTCEQPLAQMRCERSQT